jgi:tRNA1Val (adenine37-N6)-methyltransferase
MKKVMAAENKNQDSFSAEKSDCLDEALMLKTGERIDYLVDQRLRIIQNPQGFCFSMDAVLLAHFADVRQNDVVCDLGTGTGVIPLLISMRFPSVRIDGLEIQDNMADMASRSVKLNGLEGKITIHSGDLRNACRIFSSSRFDLVTSNPPYMPTGTGIQNQTPEIAAARHEVLCSLEDVINSASQIVRSRGRVALVHKPQRLVDIFCLMRHYRIEPKRFRLVYPKLNSEPNMVLVEGVKDGKPGMMTEKPLYVYQSDGEYTQEVRSIYFDIPMGVNPDE